MPKMAVGNMGWMAVFTDPTGNQLALWQGNESG
jgi:predicted enzyme related to lactoylglutathione lyase